MGNFIGYANTEQEFQNKIDNREFIEAAYFVVPTNTDGLVNRYYPSIRETNADNTVQLLYNSNDILKTYFSLEIVWGYYGWEWVDYEHNGETLKGGNFYQLRPMSKVKHIDDGYRLQHINNFLSKVNNVTEVEDFDTSALVSAKNAFTTSNSSTLNVKIEEFPELENASYMFATNSNYSKKIYAKTTSFPKVKDASYMFNTYQIYCDCVEFPEVTNASYMFKGNNYWYSYDGSVYQGRTLSLPKATNCKGLKQEGYQYYNNNFYLPEATDLSYFFYDATLQNLPSEVNLVDWLGIDPKKVTTYSNMLSKAYSWAGGITWVLDLPSDHNTGTVNLSYMFAYTFTYLKNSTVNINNDCNINCECMFRQYGNYSSATGTPLTLNIKNIDKITNSSLMFAYAHLTELPFKEFNSLFWKSGNNKNAQQGLYRLLYVDKFDFDYQPSGEFFDTGNIIRSGSWDRWGLGQIQIRNANGETDCFTIRNADKISNIQHYYTFQTPIPISGIFTSEEHRYDYKHIEIITNATRIEDQIIYADYTMFQLKAENIDFVDSNVELYCWSNNGETLPQWSNMYTNWIAYVFENCSSMTKTPKLHVHYNQGLGNDSTDLRFDNLTNLTYFDGEDFNITGYANWEAVLNLNLPNLVYLKLGQVNRSLNIQNCKNLDIPTLEESLMRQVSGGCTNKTLYINRVIYDQLSDECITHLATAYSAITIKENA